MIKKIGIIVGFFIFYKHSNGSGSLYRMYNKCSAEPDLHEHGFSDRASSWTVRRSQ